MTRQVTNPPPPPVETASTVVPKKLFVKRIKWMG